MRVGGRESESSQHSIFMQYQRRAEKNGRARSTRSLGRASTGSTCSKGWRDRKMTGNYRGNLINYIHVVAITTFHFQNVSTCTKLKVFHLLFVLFGGFVDVAVDKWGPGLGVTTVTATSTSTGKQLIREQKEGKEGEEGEEVEEVEEEKEEVKESRWNKLWRKKNQEMRKEERGREEGGRKEERIKNSD